MSHEPDDKSAPDDDLSALRQRVADLSRELDEARRARALLQERAAEQAALLAALPVRAAEQSALLDALPVMVFFKDRQHKYLLVNRCYADHHRLPVDAIVGKRDYDIFVEETARTYHESDELVMASGEPKWNIELRFQLADGSDGWTLENDVPYRDASGAVVGMVGVVIDVTARKRAEEALRSTEAELRTALDRQARLVETVRALSTPVLPIDEGVLVVPLIGHIDSTRSAQIMDALLAAVDGHGADSVILDLTGVPFIDTSIASHLLRAAQAVSLLGAECILVGISGATAQSLVHIGVEMQAMVILRDLRAGVRYATTKRRRAAAPPRGAPDTPAPSPPGRSAAGS